VHTVFPAEMLSGAVQLLFYFATAFGMLLGLMLGMRA
jgi:hypothetical protein